MKIPRSEMIRRYFVSFDEKETHILQRALVLHPYYRPGDELWFTMQELEDLKKVLPAEVVDNAIASIPKE